MQMEGEGQSTQSTNQAYQAPPFNPEYQSAQHQQPLNQPIPSAPAIPQYQHAPNPTQPMQYQQPFQTRQPLAYHAQPAQPPVIIQPTVGVPMRPVATVGIPQGSKPCIATCALCGTVMCIYNVITFVC